MSRHRRFFSAFLTIQSMPRPDVGLGLALSRRMGVNWLEDLIAWQLAHSFKLEVYELLDRTTAVARDSRFRDQLREAAASVGMNIGGGFYRFGAREFRRFLSIAIGSLGEAVLWLRDGVDRGYFAESDYGTALDLAKRCRVASLRLHRSLGTPSSPPKTPRPGRTGRPQDLEDLQHRKCSLCWT